MAIFENQQFRLCIDEDKGLFNIIPMQVESPQIANCRVLVEGKAKNGHAFMFQCDLKDHTVAPDKNFGQVISWVGMDDRSAITWEVSFALPPDDSLVFWRVCLTNHSSIPVFLDRITMLEPDRPDSANVLIPDAEESANLAFHANGWQSWSYTCTYGAEERMRRTRLGTLQAPMVHNPGTPVYRSVGKFSSDFFGVLADRCSRTGLLLGFLSQKNHFGTITADIRRAPTVRLWANGDHARLDPQTSIITDWAVLSAIQIDDPDPLKSYLDAVGKTHAIKDLPDAPAGWCSWYYYYQAISPETIRDDLRQINSQKDKLPLDLVQIDDGFEAEVGDWLEFKPAFSQGVKPLAEEIKASGFTPGLWLAPFILHPRSRLAVEHPDWLLRGKNGKLARAGFVWNTLPVALDLTVPEALEYVCKVMDVAVHQWGYPYLKLDFLYAAALKSVYRDGTRTRAQVLRSGMEAIRRTVGEETILLGCGAPLGSMLGLAQAMRIGADVNASWRPKYFGIESLFRNEPHMPSARNSIQNILSRAALNRRWWVNDPDCLLVRPNSDLSLDEVRTLATAIGMTGGSVLLSDKMAELPPERLEIAAALLPPIQQRVQVLDWMDMQTPEKLRIDIESAVGKWHVLACFNWRDNNIHKRLVASDFHLNNDDYQVRSFWDNRVWFVGSDKPLFDSEIAPHSVLLLAVRYANNDGPIYLGSSLHISQGLEVKTWQVEKNTLAFNLDAGRQAHAFIDLYLPAEPQKAFHTDGELSWEILSSNCFRFTFNMDKKDKVKINF